MKVFEFAFQCEQALFARDVGEIENLRDRALHIMRWVGNDEGGAGRRLDYDRQRVLHTTGAEGPSGDDDKRRQLENGSEMAPFECLSADDRAEGYDNTYDCGDIHSSVTSPSQRTVAFAIYLEWWACAHGNRFDSVQPNHTRFPWRCSCGPCR